MADYAMTVDEQIALLAECFEDVHSDAHAGLALAAAQRDRLRGNSDETWPEHLSSAVLVFVRDAVRPPDQRTLDEGEPADDEAFLCMLLLPNTAPLVLFHSASHQAAAEHLVRRVERALDQSPEIWWHTQWDHQMHPPRARR